MVQADVAASTDRIRVARVITRLNVGGPAIQAMLLTRRLDPARFETRLVCGVPGPREGDMAALRPEPGVAPIVLPHLGREISPLDDLRTLAQLMKLFRTFRPHVVHTHLAKAGVLGRLAARLTGVPVVIHTFHGNVLSGYFGPGRSRAFALIERGMARLSTCVAAISPGQRRELEARGIATRDRIVELPLGLDLEPFLRAAPGALRDELGLSADIPVVGVVARLVAIKRIDVFLAAAERVVARRPDLICVVLGDGPLRPALEEQARERALPVRFLGWRADLPAVYADLDVVVLTSDNEGTPVSVIEALAGGRAVVATDVGGVRDVIGSDGGRLVPPRDPDAVATAILELLADPSLRSRLGATGRTRVYPEYDASTLVRRVTSLYEERLGRIQVNR